MSLQVADSCAMMRDMTDTEQATRVAARVRAALAYAALTYDDAADVTPIGASTLRRITSPKNPRGASLDELLQIANATGVPLEWLTGGSWDEGAQREALFPGLGVGSRERRLAVVEHYLGQLLALERVRVPVQPPPTQLEPVSGS